MASMDIYAIMKTLPHRYPMLLVDRVLECDDEKHIVGMKNLTYNEPFFDVHFPDEAVMPAVLQLEALAQLGGILLNRITGNDLAIAYFLAVDKARFRRPCVPGDQLILEIELKRSRLRMARVHGTLKVDGVLACEADLMFGYK